MSLPSSSPPLFSTHPYDIKLQNYVKIIGNILEEETKIHSKNLKKYLRYTEK